MGYYNLSAEVLRAHDAVSQHGQYMVVDSIHDIERGTSTCKKYSTLISFLTDKGLTEQQDTIDLSSQKELIEEIRAQGIKIPFFTEKSIEGREILKKAHVQHQIDALKEGCHQVQQDIQNTFTSVNQQKQDLKDFTDIARRMLQELSDLVQHMLRRLSPTSA